MSDQQPPVQVVQCPKCGSPVGTGKPGAITSCSYCGSPLQLSVGASGHPIARLANIETSTVYLARTEALKRVREQLAETELSLHAMREMRDATQQEIKDIERNKDTLWVLGLLVGLISASALLIESTGCGLAGLTLAFVLLVAGISRNRGATRQVANVRLEQETMCEHARLACAERDRLAARVTELEAGLDELADKL